MGSKKISPTFGDFSPSIKGLSPTVVPFVATGRLSLHFCRKTNHFTYGVIKKELEKTKELARLYYLNGDTQKLVAEKVGVSRVTVNKWVSEGGWDALRTAKSITRKELVAKIMRKADERLESGEMTADEMAKLAASIEKIDKRTNATTIIEVLTLYNNWLVSRTQIDKELTVDFLKMTNRYQDTFIAEQVSAESPAL
mgnify:CR=1 FL=1|jgi:transposase-like protein